MTGRQLHPPVKRKRPTLDSRHCGREFCPCTHTAPCHRGWLPAPDRVNPNTGMAYEQVAPCPVCRPDAADRLADRLRRESKR